LAIRQRLAHQTLPDDKVRVKRSAGRILELADEALVLDVYQGRLWYRLMSQGSDGGSLSEGGDRAWCWSECEVVNESLIPMSRRGAYNVAESALEKVTNHCSTNSKVGGQVF